jgi:hypothetical protein
MIVSLSRLHATSIARGFRDCQVFFEKSFFSFFWSNSYSDPVLVWETNKNLLWLKNRKKQPPPLVRAGVVSDLR